MTLPPVLFLPTQADCVGAVGLRALPTELLGCSTTTTTLLYKVPKNIRRIFFRGRTMKNRISWATRTARSGAFTFLSAAFERQARCVCWSRMKVRSQRSRSSGTTITCVAGSKGTTQPVDGATSAPCTRGRAASIGGKQPCRRRRQSRRSEARQSGKNR